MERKLIVLSLVLGLLVYNGCKKHDGNNQPVDQGEAATTSVNVTILSQDKEEATTIGGKSILIARYNSRISSNSTAVRVEGGKISEYSPGAEEAKPPYCLIYFKGDFYQTSPKQKINLSGVNKKINNGVSLGVSPNSPFDRIECYSSDSKVTVNDVKAALGEAFDVISSNN